MMAGMAIPVWAKDTLQLQPYKVHIIQSGSMAPTLPVGSVIISQSLPPEQYQVGDIVTFMAANKPRVLVTHRIAALSISTGGTKVFQTKGDANTNGDLWINSLGSITGKTVAVIPWLGYPLIWLKTVIGFWVFSAGILVLLAITLKGMLETPPAVEQKT